MCSSSSYEIYTYKMDFESSCSSPVVSDENQAPVATEAELVAKVLQFAKINLKDVNSAVQRIYFSPSLQNEDVKLLELNPTIEKQLSENGGKLVLKGNATDNVVLCTDNQTFEVKDTEISNSLLLVPGVQLELATDDERNGAQQEIPSSLCLSDIYVDSVCHSYLELRPIKPKINSILTLLEPSSYDGPEKEDTSVNKLTLTDILTEASASDGEIKKALFDLHAIEINGYIRLIEFDYLSRVIGSVSDLIDENSQTFDNFSHDTTVSTLSELYPEDVVRHVLKSYGSPVFSEDSAATSSWCLCEDKVCRYFAEMLLKPTRKFNLGEFLDAWKDSVPEGMITSLSQLNGMAFADRSSEPAVMRYFPVEQLSEDVKTRFEQLFNAKKSWTLEEITPYVEPLCISKLMVSVLVMKNARAFTKGGIKYFTSKYLKN